VLIAIGFEGTLRRRLSTKAMGAGAVAAPEPMALASKALVFSFLITMFIGPPMPW
jgi:hypothetical protein